MDQPVGITPTQVQAELVRLTGTADRPSKTIVVPVLAFIEGKQIDVVRIAFECDGVPVAANCLPVHLLKPLPDFVSLILVPLAVCWAAARFPESAEWVH